MLDGDSQPDRELRQNLLKARDIASAGGNPVLVYILEMALDELSENGLSDVPGPQWTRAGARSGDR